MKTETSQPLETQPSDGLYDYHKVTSLMVNSFRFSRGRANAQTDILAFLAHNYGLRFTSAAINDAIGPTTQAALRHVDSPKHPGGLYKPENTSEEVAGFFRKLERFIANRTPAYSPDMLAGMLIAADYNSIPAIDDPGRDYSSNVINYGLLGRTTGIEEYDAMFKEVSDTIAAYHPSSNHGSAADWLRSEYKKLPRIKDAHLKHHPSDASELEIAQTSSRPQQNP